MAVEVYNSVPAESKLYAVDRNVKSRASLRSADRELAIVLAGKYLRITEVIVGERSWLQTIQRILAVCIYYPDQFTWDWE
ncbi:hypothetical protein LguiB_031866 [Lonicera macranthoides]